MRRLRQAVEQVERFEARRQALHAPGTCRGLTARQVDGSETCLVPAAPPAAVDVRTDEPALAAGLALARGAARDQAAGRTRQATCCKSAFPHEPCSSKRLRHRRALRPAPVSSTAQAATKFAPQRARTAPGRA